MDSNRVAFASFPSWKNNTWRSEGGKNSVLDCDCGSVEGLLYYCGGPSFVGRKLERNGNKNGFAVHENLSVFPQPVFLGAEFTDPLWTGDDIVEKYVREVDLSIYDHMDAELKKWEEFHRSPIEILVQRDRDLKKMYRLIEHYTINGPKDDPEFLGNCLSLCGDAENFKLALGTGAACGILRILLLDQASSVPDFEIHCIKRLKFPERICQLQLDSGGNLVVCRTENNIFLCSDDSSCKDTSESLWKAGRFRNFALSPHIQGDIALLDCEGGGQWGKMGAKNLISFEEDPASDTKCCCWSDHPRVLYLLSDSSLKLCDLRCGGPQHSFCSFEQEKAELVSETFSDCLIPVGTDRRLLIFDDRKPDIPIQSWAHSLVGGVNFIHSYTASTDVHLCATQRLFNESVVASARIRNTDTLSTEGASYLSSPGPIRRTKGSSINYVTLVVKQHQHLRWPESVKRRTTAAIRGGCVRTISVKRGPAPFLFTSSDCGDLYCQKLLVDMETDKLSAEDFSVRWISNLERLEDSTTSCKTQFRSSFSCVDLRDCLLETKLQKPRISTTSDCHNCRNLSVLQSHITVKQSSSASEVNEINTYGDERVTNIILNAWDWQQIE